MYNRIYSDTYMYMYILKCIYMCVCIYTCVCVCACVCVYPVSKFRDQD